MYESFVWFRTWEEDPEKSGDICIRIDRVVGLFGGIHRSMIIGEESRDYTDIYVDKFSTGGAVRVEGHVDNVSIALGIQPPKGAGKCMNVTDTRAAQDH